MLLPESDFAARIEAQGKAAVLLIWQNIPETTYVYFFPEVEGNRLQEMITCQGCFIDAVNLPVSREKAMENLSEFLETPEAKKRLLRGASDMSEKVPSLLDCDNEATEDFVIKVPTVDALPNLVVIRCGFFM